VPNKLAARKLLSVRGIAGFVLNLPSADCITVGENVQPLALITEEQIDAVGFHTLRPVSRDELLKVATPQVGKD
jgi:hypothetical protein